MTQWKDYCEESGYSASLGDVGPAQAAGFLAWLADSESVSAGTISGYRSAMRWHWNQERGWPENGNPFDSQLADATLRGITRTLAPMDRAARAERVVTAALEPKQVVRLNPILSPDVATDEQVMVWAAALLGSYGLLRPNEFLGSYAHVDRHLRSHQLEYFVHRGTPSPVQITVGHHDNPSEVRIRLGATKADQLGKNKPLVIRQRIAVQALWCWSRRRLAYSFETQVGPFFRVEGQRPLSIRSLLDRLQQAMRTVDPDWNHRLTGRCFRRGGATELVRDGAPLEQIQAAGRWRSPAMVLTYSEPAAVQQRAAAAASGTASPLVRSAPRL